MPFPLCSPSVSLPVLLHRLLLIVVAPPLTLLLDRWLVRFEPGRKTKGDRKGTLFGQGR